MSEGLPPALTVFTISRRTEDCIVPVLDELGRPIFLQSEKLATILAAAMVALGAEGTTVKPMPLAPDVGDLLLALGLDEHAFSLVEAQAVSREDALRSVAELAERLTRVER